MPDGALYIHQGTPVRTCWCIHSTERAIVLPASPASAFLAQGRALLAWPWSYLLLLMEKFFSSQAQFHHKPKAAKAKVQSWERRKEDAVPALAST